MSGLLARWSNKEKKLTVPPERMQWPFFKVPLATDKILVVVNKADKNTTDKAIHARRE